MNEQDSVSIARWTAKSEKLLEDVRRLLNKIGCDERGMPREVFAGDWPPSLVFAGQYSAGKSSILKALTGIEGIEIGDGITTKEAHSYDWHGIEVIDTPGIHTTLRPDHDEISYHAIAGADLLVYVITQELFDDHIGQNFRRLLLEEDKAGEMMLVVNKMADIGNTIENQEIKLQDLEKVTRPYTPAQLRTTFLDAESYLDSLWEPDPEIAAELRERSNYHTLVTTLNTFVQDQAIPGRLTTVLYRLLEFLHKVILQYQPSTGDSDADALEELLLQQRRIIVQSQWRLETAAKSIIEEGAAQICQKGREIANSLCNFDNEADAEAAIEAARKEADAITAACVDSLTGKITELSDDCRMQLDGFYKSDFSQALKFRLESKRAKGNPLIERLYKSDILAQGSSKIIAGTAGTNVTAGGLKAFTGSNIHQGVLKAGRLIGHSFKPWEAVKYVRGINAFAKALGVAAVVLSLGMQAKEDADADKLQQERRKNREELRAYFNNIADEAVKHFNKELAGILAEGYLAPIAEIDAQVSEIRTMRTGKSEKCQLLEQAQADCRLLISHIHQNQARDGS